MIEVFVEREDVCQNTLLAIIAFYYYYSFLLFLLQTSIYE